MAPVLKDEGSGSKKPTAAVPGLPGLGSAKSTRGAALLSDAGLPRRPIAPLPPPPVPPLAGSSSGAGLAAPAAAAVPSMPMAPAAGLAAPSAAPAAGAPPMRAGALGTQLADQFRESVQAGGVPDDLPQEGWFVGVNGVPLGPIPLDDLRELAIAGHIDRRSLVWRDGQAEWRPLGKFPGLVRLIDDGAAPAATPQAEPLASSPAAAAPRPNGAMNGQHVASGFEVVRAESGGPSAWGDLDDEDDEDEQPTTVKGRVSVLPNGGAPPAPTPSASPPPVAPIGVAPAPTNPFGITSAPLSPPGVPLASSPSSVASAAPAPASPFAALPEPGVENDDVMIRPSTRNRWYLIIAAIVFAFALGAIVTHLMRAPSTAEKPGKRAGIAQPALPGAEPRRYEPTQAVAEDAPSLTTERRALSVQPAAAATSSAPITAALAPSAVPPRSGAKSDLASQFLARLGSSSPAAPSLDPRSAGTGLDATAIQRTVRRHSPGVRQNCWLRARESRAPGVPSSAKVSATITVDPSGRVQGVSVSGTPRGYPGLARCIESNVKGWQFPRSGAQTITNVPFMFVGQ